MHAEATGLQSTWMGAADLHAHWHRKSMDRCVDNADAVVRLRVALEMMGADPDLDAEPEPGISQQQTTIEGLIRSVSAYLSQ